MPNLDRVLETALYFDDMPRAKDFYERVLGLTPMFGDHRLIAYAIGGTVLLLFGRGSSLETAHMPGGTIPPHDGDGPQHVAFAIPHDDLAPWERKLTGSGVAIEGRTRWPKGGESIYFRDPGNHLLELVTPGVWTNY